MNSLNLNKNSYSNNHPPVLRVVLDEPRLFVEQSIGSAMVRGEVIVNFPTDTLIQGPIELVFEGIQRFHPWAEIMRGSSFGSSIETKLQVTELSLLPPNSKGVMPAGIQRFPFEFPIPASLPTSVDIPKRLHIFYQVSATLRRSPKTTSSSEQQTSLSPINIIGWAKRNNMFKRKYTASTPMRIVRAMESIVSSGLPNSDILIRSQQQQMLHHYRNTTASRSSHEDENASIRTNRSSGTNGSSSHVVAAIQQDDTLIYTDNDRQLPWNRRNLDGYQPAATTFDEQPDLLAFSLAGRSASNLTATNYDDVQGIRYKIGVDRTAIAIGTSVGIELMIEPTIATAVIRSVMLKICETRTYAMKVPGAYTRGFKTPETKRAKEVVNMALKWAYGYKIEEDTDNSDEDTNTEEAIGEAGVCKGSSSTKKSKRLIETYVRQRNEHSKYLAYFDPPQPGGSTSKSFLNRALLVSYSEKDSPPSTSTFMSKNENKKKLSDGQTACVMAEKYNGHEMINLKLLKQTVRVGEYFGGRFVLPVPDCSNILNPTIDYESINIHHWLQLVVTIECNGKLFDLTLDSPARMLDCRVVAADDECQTILPPPPSYDHSMEPASPSPAVQNEWPQGTFWEQRELITSVDGWGSCVPCPCELRKLKKNDEFVKDRKSNKNAIIDTSSAKKTAALSPMNRAYHTNTTLLRRSNSISTALPTTAAHTLTPSADNCLPSQMPEWGPPPCYSEN
ncbi:hypothetical protein BDF20DRAFT_905605 [Mycotypha africana]|uniref:uncharacterized protein n=1 Tax=Mycotypha africana TaxID=64632 RepID=UPI002301710D|nr:uncharacterized protein BDF20DRAFT_905605 [Mycotypha africana]KAI8981787.1 hypothetical protein BDF20DRAFT_905605 [Mycotypha africana]